MSVTPVRKRMMVLLPLCVLPKIQREGRRGFFDELLLGRVGTPPRRKVDGANSQPSDTPPAEPAARRTRIIFRAAAALFKGGTVDRRRFLSFFLRERKRKKAASTTALRSTSGLSSSILQSPRSAQPHLRAADFSICRESSFQARLVGVKWGRPANRHFPCGDIPIAMPPRRFSHASHLALGRPCQASCRLPLLLPSTPRATADTVADMAAVLPMARRCCPCRRWRLPRWPITATYNHAYYHNGHYHYGYPGIGIGIGLGYPYGYGYMTAAWPRSDPTPIYVPALGPTVGPTSNYAYYPPDPNMPANIAPPAAVPPPPIQPPASTAISVPEGRGHAGYGPRPWVAGSERRGAARGEGDRHDGPRPGLLVAEARSGREVHVHGDRELGRLRDIWFARRARGCRCLSLGQTSVVDFRRPPQRQEQ